MKMKLILLFFISFYLASFSIKAQETAEIQTDSIPKKTEKYGIRVGGDLSKLARTAYDKGYSGFEVQGDLRFAKRFYAAVEVGFEDREWDKDQLVANANGSYVKIGADFNAYRNWLGMNNAIFAGLRYGIASFSQELTSYRIYTTDTTFPAEIRNEPREYSGLSASWTEFIFGVKTEILSNLYLSINVQLKHLISEKKPENFDNLVIPGFNRTYDFSDFGVGYGYTISYLIPILKR